MRGASRAAPATISLRAAALALSLLAPALGGCASQATQIEQGRTISTGKQPYDEFFEAVRTLRAASLTAEQQTTDARADLARALGLDAGSNAESTLDAAHERAVKLRDSGMLLHIEITPQGKMVSTKGRRPLQSEDKRVIDAVEASVKSSLEVSTQLGALSKRAAELESKRTVLEADSKAIFAEDPNRRAIAREITAAGRVLTESGALVDKYAGVASRFVLELAHAVETGAGADPRGAARQPAASRPATPTKWPPRRSSSGPVTPVTPKPKAPPQQQHGGDDFDP